MVFLWRFTCKIYLPLGIDLNQSKLEMVWRACGGNQTSVRCFVIAIDPPARLLGIPSGLALKTRRRHLCQTWTFHQARVWMNWDCSRWKIGVCPIQQPIRSCEFLHSWTLGILSDFLIFSGSECVNASSTNQVNCYDNLWKVPVLGE